jgi:ubiquinone/menaquinone biosynthesis C-methylase UbiE
MTWQESWTRRFYRSRPGWLDGTAEFHSLCRSCAPPSARILEVGAGPTNATSAFLATLGAVHGVDVSDEVRGNVHLASSALVERGRYPFPDASFDLVVSNYVVEHVDDARLHLAEIERVLVSGGTLRFPYAEPPALRSHRLARFTAHGTHKLLANRSAQPSL